METLSNQMPGQYVSPGGFEAAPESKFDFWGVLNRRKWIVFLGMLTGIGIGFLYHLYTPVVYQSEAVIRISPKSPNYIRLSRLSSEAVAPDIEQILPTRHDNFRKLLNDSSRSHSHVANWIDNVTNWKHSNTNCRRSLLRRLRLKSS